MHFFPKIINFRLTVLNIYLVYNKADHFLKKYIFNRKKWYFLEAGFGSFISRNGSEDPDPL